MLRQLFKTKYVVTWYVHMHLCPTYLSNENILLLPGSNEIDGKLDAVNKLVEEFRSSNKVNCMYFLEFS